MRDITSRERAGAGLKKQSRVDLYSGGPSGQTRTGPQDGDLQSGTDNSEAMAELAALEAMAVQGAQEAMAGGLGPLGPAPTAGTILPPKKISLGKLGGIRSPPGLDKQDST